MKKYSARQMELIIAKLHNDIAEAINIKYKDVVEKRSAEFETTELYSLIKQCDELASVIVAAQEKHGETIKKIAEVCKQVCHKDLNYRYDKVTAIKKAYSVAEVPKVPSPEQLETEFLMNDGEELSEIIEKIKKLYI